MAEDGTQTGGTESSTSSTTGGGNGTGTGQTGEESRSGQELSREALEAELRRARDDAAKYRTRAREFADDDAYQRAKSAVEALDKAEQDKKSEVEKLTEKNEGLQYQASQSEKDNLRLRAALASGVPTSQVDELASRLKGETLEELTTDAKKLAEFFGGGQSSSTRRSDPSQGRGNADNGDSGSDPLVQMLTDMVGSNE